MRHTRAHTKNRRSHHKMEKPTLSVNESGVTHMRHRASSTTGTYRGRQVIDVEAKIAKKEAKRKKVGTDEGADK